MHEQVYDSYFQAVKSLKDQGFRHKEYHSHKEDKMIIYRKGRSYKVLTSKYCRYLGKTWHIRSWTGLSRAQIV
jgi:hypothetical protein